MKKSIIGAASEHQVLGQLLWRCWIATLAYRLFYRCEGKGWVNEATLYKVLVSGRGEAHRLASEIFDSEPEG